MTKILRDRYYAGQQLAKKLIDLADRSDVIVLGLPRGGVPVAFEIAKKLHAPLDTCVVRKLGVPGHEELGMGAIGSGGVILLNETVVRWEGIDQETIERVALKEKRELERRECLYRGEKPFPDLRNRTVILVDDGIATGSTIKAAIVIVQQQKPKSLIIAVPVAPLSTCKELEAEVDRVVYLITPEPLYSISLWYDNFSQTTDAEVRHLLRKAEGELTATSN